MEVDFFEIGEGADQLVPDPNGDVLRGGIFQSGNIVEVVVVKRFFDRFECGFYIGEVSDPAESGVEGGFEHDADPIGVAVYPAAFVVLRHKREAMCRIHSEFLENLHFSHCC